MVIRDKAQRFVMRWSKGKPVLIAPRHDGPAHIASFSGIRDQPEGLTPIAAFTIKRGFRWLTCFRVDRDLLNTEWRTDFDLHPVRRCSEHYTCHGELNEQP